MTDERIEGIIGNLLRFGVFLAALVVLAGGFWYVAHAGWQPISYSHFHPSIRGVRAVASLPGPLALIQIGLLILIATPIVRVAFSLAGFALERDWMYVGFTLIVLSVLISSLVT